MDNLSRHILKLTLIPGLGPKKIGRILEKELNLEKIEEYADNIFYELGIDKQIIQDIKSPDLSQKLEEEIQQITTKKIKLINCQQPTYPSLLKEIYNFPPLLHYFGEIPNDDHFFIAFVGTRRASNYGMEHTRRLIKELAEYLPKVVIVSGLAYGIDAVAHQAALDYGVKTIAILGSGLGKLYPKSHASLANEIVKQGGAVCSEFSTLVPPNPSNFPARNRIVSGLSSVVVVTEAPSKSGALISAQLALEQNREVCALPGPVDKSSYQGCNNLIKQGAYLVTTVKDILEVFGSQKELPQLEQKEPTKPKESDNLNKQEQEIVDFLNLQPSPIEEIATKLAISVVQTMQLLTVLELKGYLRVEAGGTYCPTS